MLDEHQTREIPVLKVRFQRDYGIQRKDKGDRYTFIYNNECDASRRIN